jgi:hypothetical protein
MPSAIKKQKSEGGNTESPAPSQISPDCKSAHPIHDEQEQDRQNDLGEQRHLAMMAQTFGHGKASDRAAIETIKSLRNFGLQQDADTVLSALQSKKRADAALMAARYVWNKEVHIWSPFLDLDSPDFEPGDLVAINTTQPILPRQMAAFGVAGTDLDTLAVSLGLTGDDVAVFYNPGAANASLPLTYPLEELTHFVGVIGVASPCKAFEALDSYSFPSAALAIIESWESNLLRVPITAFNRGGLVRHPLPAQGEVRQ